MWCAAARLVATHKRVISVLSRVGPWAVPVVLTAIGVFILVRTGVVVRLARLVG